MITELKGQWRWASSCHGRGGDAAPGRHQERLFLDAWSRKPPSEVAPTCIILGPQAEAFWGPWGCPAALLVLTPLQYLLPLALVNASSSSPLSGKA